MQRKYSLRTSDEFKHVREAATPQQHQLCVVYAAPVNAEHVRVGLSVSKRFGSAVHRNRMRRRLRAVVRALLPVMSPHWEIVIIARNPAQTATYAQLQVAVDRCLRRSGVIGATGIGDPGSSARRLPRPNPGSV